METLSTLLVTCIVVALLQLSFYGLSGREQVIQSVLDGTSDVGMAADWLFAAYVKQGKFNAQDFVFIGPNSVTPATEPYSSYVYTRKLPRPETYLASMPCK